MMPEGVKNLLCSNDIDRGVVADHVEGIKCISFRATAILILEIAAYS